MSLRMDLALGGTMEILIRTLSIPAFIVGLRGDVSCANDLATTAISGGAGPPLTGRFLTNLCPLTSADLVSTWLDDIVANRSTKEHLPIPITHRIGVSMWIGTPLKDPNGTLIGFLVQCAPDKPQRPDLDDPPHEGRDLDAQRLDALEYSNLRWKTAVLSANQGVWDHDFENDRHFLSESWHIMRGVAKGDAVAETTEDWLQTLHPNDITHVKTQLEMQETGATDDVKYQFRQRHSNGEWIWILSRGRVVRRSATGAPVRIIGTDTEISDVKSAEADRDRLTKRLGMAMDVAEMGLWEFQTNSTEVYWDQRTALMFGVSDTNTLHPLRDWLKRVHPDDRRNVLAGIKPNVQARQDIACDYRIVTEDGTERYIRTLGKFLPDFENGSRYTGVNFDLTPDRIKALELEQARSQLEYESRHDALTGLANRRRLDEVFADLQIEKTNREIAVMHLDLDRFKQINDTLGHDAGDATLKHAAYVLRRCLPRDALVARAGGDEFVALFPNPPDISTLTDLAVQIIDTLGAPFFYEGNQLAIGSSIGIARTGMVENLESSLFICADMALYHAKQGGRGTYRFYTQGMNEDVSFRRSMQDGLLQAFENGEVICHYQPQFDAQTLQISGVEALVRWDCPTRGLVLPDQFLRAAEDIGLIAQLDEVVLRRALSDLETWTAAGHQMPRISVNISAERLTDPDLITRLQKLNIPPGMIVFELLESVFLDGEDETILANLKAISKMGIEVEIDDFGTGHASIISLLRISPKRLKIDRELVQPVVHSRRRRALLETIIRIGKMLDIEVVAEGVETQAHVAILRDLKCDFLQGFALARPMSASQIEDMMAASKGRDPMPH